MTNQKMPSLAEIHDRLYELEPLNLPSAKDLAHVSYEDSKAETLGYEKQYKALLDQVRDKTTEEDRLHKRTGSGNQEYGIDCVPDT